MSIETRPATAASAGTLRRSCAIDLLRGTAILLVIGCHFAVAPGTAGVLAPVAQLWYRVGWAGVDLFFVLSGFLVSGLLFAEFQRHRRVDMKRFLVRRGLKIWPAYFAYLLFLAGWLWAHRSKGGPWQDLWPNLLHLQNYFGSPRVHTWSLAVEEHFYLVAAAVWTLLLIPRRIAAVHRLFPLSAVGGLLAVALARQVEFAQGGRESLNLFATHLRFDGLLMGMLLAYLTHFAPERLRWCGERPWACLATGMALAAPVLWLTPDHDAGSAGAGLGLMYAGFALVVLGVINLEHPARRSRRLFATLPARALARMGVFSYGIYLWHLDLARTPMKKIAALAANAHLPDWATWLGVTALYVALAFLAGATMSRLIEIPMLALRDRLFPSKTGLAQPMPQVPTPTAAAADSPVLVRASAAFGT